MVLNGTGHHGTGWEQYVTAFLIDGPCKIRGVHETYPKFYQHKIMGVHETYRKFYRHKIRGVHDHMPLILRSFRNGGS